MLANCQTLEAPSQELRQSCKRVEDRDVFVCEPSQRKSKFLQVAWETQRHHVNGLGTIPVARTPISPEPPSPQSPKGMRWQPARLSQSSMCSRVSRSKLTLLCSKSCEEQRPKDATNSCGSHMTTLWISSSSVFVWWTRAFDEYVPGHRLSRKSFARRSLFAFLLRLRTAKRFLLNGRLSWTPPSSCILQQFRCPRGWNCVRRKEISDVLAKELAAVAAVRELVLVWEARSRPGCQGPQRKYEGYLSTTLRKLKVSGSGNSKVIREMIRKEMKWMEKSKRSEATLTAHVKHEDDYGMDEDPNLSHSVRMSKQGKQSKNNDTKSKKERLRKTKDFQCMMAHALAWTTLTDCPNVSGHSTHCWAFRSALRVTNSNVVAVPVYEIFWPVHEFLVEIHTAEMVLWSVVFTHPVGCRRPTSAVNDPTATK